MQAIEDSFVTIAKDDYISYILYIGRADVIPELKAHFGTSCVIDYQLDRYYDETRELFYLHYLNRNYSKEGFKYDGEAGVIDYFHQVDSTFAPYSNHPIMAFVADSLVKQGFGYHVPVAMALRLKLQNGKLHYNTDLEPDFNHYYRGITPQHEKKLIALLEDFYKKAHFHSFFKKNQPLYNACKQTMQKQLVDKIDLDWYKSFFGPINNISFHIYLGLLNGPGNYAIPQKTKDGSEIKNAFMGCADRNATGDIYYGEAYTLPVIIHEFNHSFCNPLNEEFWDDIKDKMIAFYNQNASFYAQQAYGDPLTVANEMFVEACVMRYLATHPVQFTRESIQKIKKIYQMQNASDEEIVAGYYETQINIREVYKKFFMIRDIMKALEEREANMVSYPTMRDFMPKYLEAINAYQEK